MQSQYSLLLNNQFRDERFAFSIKMQEVHSLAVRRQIKDEFSANSAEVTSPPVML